VDVSPHSSAAAVVALDDDRAARGDAVRRHLALIAAAIAVGIVVVTCAVVGHAAAGHRAEHALWNTWWAHHTAFDCCHHSGHERCAAGTEAVHTLQARLATREAEGPASRAVRALFGLDDIAVTDAPTDAATVAQLIAACPLLQR
jgi:hypothetical protein